MDTHIYWGQQKAPPKGHRLMCGLKITTTKKERLATPCDENPYYCLSTAGYEVSGRMFAEHWNTEKILRSHPSIHWCPACIAAYTFRYQHEYVIWSLQGDPS